MARLAIMVVALMAVLGAGCGQDEPDQPPPPPTPEEAGAGGTITVEGQEADVRSELDVRGESEADVVLGDDFFDPTVLIGEPGQELELHLANEGSRPHTFTIEELDIDEVLASGAEQAVTVTFPGSGTLPVLCRFHLQRGMVGEIRAAEFS